MSVQPYSGGVLITGGTGYLGHGLVRRLLDDGWTRIRVYSRGEYAQARMRRTFGDDDRIGYFIGDVRDVMRLERAMYGIQVVIHAAALKRIEVGYYNPDEMVKTNVDGAMNVIEAARRARVTRVVFTSSDKAFEPISAYGHSKALAEDLFRAANYQSLGPRHVVCRYGNVAGSTGSVIPAWRDYIEADEEVPISNPIVTRFWMHRDEAVDLVMNAMKTDEDLLIPTLPAYRLGDLYTAMTLACGFAHRYRITGLGEFEKKHESMGPGNSSDQARRMSENELEIALETV